MAGAGKERKCILSGEVMPAERLVRFVVGPEGQLVPDLAEKLPGRGIWLEARREALEKALKKGLFSRAARQKVEAPEDLGAQVGALLARRALDSLSLARRAGVLVAGQERVFELIVKGKALAVIEARDAGADGKKRLRARLKALDQQDLPVVTGPDAEQFGLALGRTNVVHAALTDQRMKSKVLADLARWTTWEPVSGSGGKGSE